MKKPDYFFSAPFILAAFVFLFCGQCSSGNNDVSLRLTNRERVRIDTLYTQKLDSLRPIWDSLCEFNHPLLLEKAVDSIVQERIAEEELLRSRSQSK